MSSFAYMKGPGHYIGGSRKRTQTLRKNTDFFYRMLNLNVTEGGNVVWMEESVMTPIGAPTPVPCSAKVLFTTKVSPIVKKFFTELSTVPREDVN